MLRVGRDQKLMTLASVELKSDGALVGQHDPLDARPEEAVQPVAQAGKG
jgi:hypothetical protein